ncbi:MAG: bifunctional precorrin-2 dehydrogenase/sirohydrochlorin ferrochelatase [Selenomonadaceae bacterium]|nr:bifunctional precorrin-2 dehydrogenase/sirohydrochlorin ferrochelatase [Selenomonadaceae bacterium]
MKFYPINLNVENKKCVVVGGGKIALEKILGLIEAGAKIEVIAPKFCEEVEELAAQKKINLIREKYSAEKISDGIILIAATNDFKLNQKILSDGREKNFLVNIVDSFDGDFTVPSRIRRGDFLLAISTGGKSPGFSRFVRQMLEKDFDENFAEGVKIISKYRQDVKKILPTFEERIKFWREVLTEEVWEMLKVGKISELEERIQYFADRAESHS